MAENFMTTVTVASRVGVDGAVQGHEDEEGREGEQSDAAKLSGSRADPVRPQGGSLQ